MPTASFSSSLFPPRRRVVTGHDQDALALVMIDDFKSTKIGDSGFGFARLWSTDEYPVDVTSVENKAFKNPELAPTGSMFVIFDVPPNSKTPLHRTTTIDYVILLRCKLVLHLDGESRTFPEEGHVIVQQGTMYAWENETDQWTRLLAVMMAAEQPVNNGRQLESHS